MAAGPDRFQSQHVTEECEKGVASPIISSYISGMVNSRDLKEIVDSQVSTYVMFLPLIVLFVIVTGEVYVDFLRFFSRLERFEKTNETLSRINALSEVRYDALQTDFRKHISLLVDMKANLDSIFKRIRLDFILY